MHAHSSMLFSFFLLCLGLLRMEIISCYPHHRMRVGAQIFAWLWFAPCDRCIPLLAVEGEGGRSRSVGGFCLVVIVVSGRVSCCGSVELLFFMGMLG